MITYSSIQHATVCNSLDILTFSIGQALKSLDPTLPIMQGSVSPFWKHQHLSNSAPRSHNAGFLLKICIFQFSAQVITLKKLCQCQRKCYINILTVNYLDKYNWCSASLIVCTFSRFEPCVVQNQLF